MILLHEADAPRDLPSIGVKRGEPVYHLLSDLPGHAGTAELLALARAVGGHDAWLQAPGTYREHFDLFGAWATEALAAGARPATNAEVAAALAAKRAAMALAPVALPTLTSRQMSAAIQLATDHDPAARSPLILAGMTPLLALVVRLLDAKLAGKRVIVVGGLGFVGMFGVLAAQRLIQSGAEPAIAIVIDRVEFAPLIERTYSTEPFQAPVTAGVAPIGDLAGADLIIDALSLEDFTENPDGMRETIAAINLSSAPVLSIELPAGLDPNEGGPGAPCVRASATLALGLPLRGLAQAASRPFAGDLWLGDIGLPRRVLKQVGARVGAVFAAGPLVRLERAPLAGDLVPSAIDVLRVAEVQHEA